MLIIGLIRSVLSVFCAKLHILNRTGFFCILISLLCRVGIQDNHLLLFFTLNEVKGSDANKSIESKIMISSTLMVSIYLIIWTLLQSAAPIPEEIVISGISYLNSDRCYLSGFAIGMTAAKVAIQLLLAFGVFRSRKTSSAAQLPLLLSIICNDPPICMNSH
jgi:hypothetical protein